MKRISNVFFVILIVFFPTSCAVHSGLTFNTNNNITNVVLQSNNYRVVQYVEGSASGTMILCFGGSFRPLVENARSKMLGHAHLVGSSRAIINETVEVNNKYFIVAGVKTVTVSAYVIEFIDNNSMLQQYVQPSSQQQNTQSQAIQPQQQTSNISAIAQSQTQPKSTPPLSSIQISGWENMISTDGTQSQKMVTLTAQRQETGLAYPQYLITGIDGRNLNQPIVASFDNRYNSYVFYENNVSFQFTVK